MARPKKYSDEELCKILLELQTKTPRMTEGGLCAHIGVSRDYISERAKDSPELSDTRKRIAAIRERAWAEHGLKIIDSPPRQAPTQSQVTTFIWMTRNILGWRDKAPEQDDKDKDAAAPGAPTPQAGPITDEWLRGLVEKARGVKNDE